MFTLAHLSDPHLSDWPLPGPGALLSKRILGFLSWQLMRRRIHRKAMLDLVVRDLAATGADHIAVTGDITNISLPGEFAQAARWLERLGPPDRVSVIPGNHDSYIDVPWSAHLELWARYMTSDDRAVGEFLAKDARDAFPYLRRRGDVAIVGVSTAVPMPYNSAGGSLGQAQLARLAVMLAGLGRERAFRVILIHHPPQGYATKPLKSLGDAGEFRALVARTGAELILHGHTHRAHLDKITGPNGAVPVLGVPSASALPRPGRNAAGYHLYRIVHNDRDWDLEVETRAVAAARDQVETTGRFRLLVARA